MIWIIVEPAKHKYAASSIQWLELFVWSPFRTYYAVRRCQTNVLLLLSITISSSWHSAAAKKLDSIHRILYVIGEYDVLSEWRSLSCMACHWSKANRDGRPFFGLRGLLVSRFVLIGTCCRWYLTSLGRSFLSRTSWFIVYAYLCLQCFYWPHYLILWFGRCLLRFQGFLVGLSSDYKFQHFLSRFVHS